MSTLAIAPTLLDPVGGEPTLDELVSGVWEGLAAHRVVECPVCRGEMEPVYGVQASLPDDSDAAARREAGCRAGRKPEGGRCAACGTTVR